MKRIILIHPLESRLEKLAEGFRGFPLPHFPLAFEETPLLPGEVTERIAKGLELFAEVRRAASLLEHALAARERAIPKLKVFAAEAGHVARRHFGGDAEKMATFGVTRVARPPRRASKPTREEVTAVVEEVIVAEAETRRGRTKRARRH